MANVLHIVASPRGEQSASREVAEAFLETHARLHPNDDIVTLDLYKDAVPEFGPLSVSGKYKIMYGRKQSQAEMMEWRRVEAAVAGLKAADKLVVSSPMWNFSIPYRLKQYIDVIVQPGLTFSFSHETGYKGLVTGRPAMLFLSRGGRYVPRSTAAAMDFQRPYLEAILGFIGFTDITTIVIEPMIEGGPQLGRQRVQEAIEAARLKGKAFMGPASTEPGIPLESSMAYSLVSRGQGYGQRSPEARPR